MSSESNDSNLKVSTNLKNSQIKQVIKTIEVDSNQNHFGVN